MWCTVRPPRRHRRRKVPEVARPPRGEGDGQGGLRVLVVVGHADLPALPRRLSGDRDVTAEAHEHPAACEIGRPRRDAVGGQRLGRGAQVQPDAARRTQRPLLGVPLQPSPARAPDRRARRAGRRRGPGRSRGRSPARERPRRSSGRRRRWSAPPPGARRTPPRRAAAPPATVAPRAAFTREISESGRKRLHAASIAANSSIRTAPAAGRPVGSVVKSATEVPHTARSIRPVALLVTTRPRWSGRVGSPDEAAGPAAAGPSAPTMAPGARECAERSAGAERPRAARWTGASPRGGRDPRPQAPDPTERTRPRKGPTPPSPRLPRARSSTGSAAGCRPPARGVGRRKEGASRRRVLTAMFGDSSEPARLRRPTASGATIGR